jgi:hypothetical protein
VPAEKAGRAGYQDGLHAQGPPEKPTSKPQMNADERG